MAFAAAPFLSLAAGTFAEPPDFQREIRPILSNNCFHCHGPDEKERKGGEHGYRLDTRTARSRISAATRRSSRASRRRASCSSA